MVPVPWPFGRRRRRHTSTEEEVSARAQPQPEPANASSTDAGAEEPGSKAEPMQDMSRPQPSERNAQVPESGLVPVGREQGTEKLQGQESSSSTHVLDVCNEGSKSKESRESARSNKSDSSLRSYSSSMASSLRNETVKQMKAAGSLGRSTNRFIFEDDEKPNRKNKSMDNLVSHYSPFHSINENDNSYNHILDRVTSIRAHDPDDAQCFPCSMFVPMDNEGKKQKESADNDANVFPVLKRMRQEKDLPAHLHGAPSKGKILHAIEKFQHMSNFGSQNFEFSDSNLDRRAALTMPRKYYMSAEIIRWLLALAIGISMGIVSFLVSWAIEVLINVRHDTTERYISEGMNGSAIAFYMCLAIALSLAAAVSSALIAPTAAGSGFAEMKVYLNGIHIPGVLRLTTFIIKAFGLICSVPAGLFIGTAGPFVHLGGILGGGIGSLGSNMLNFKLNKDYLDFQTEYEHRNFVIIGIASGLSTIFTAPIGGVLAAYEDCGSFHLASTKSFWQCFMATCAGVYVNYVLKLLRQDDGNIMYDTVGVRRAFALYTDAVADYSKFYRYKWWEVFIFGLMGVFAGLVGTMFVNAHLLIMRTRKKYIATPVKRISEVAVVAVITVTITLVASYFSPCKPLPSDIGEYPMTDSSGQNPNFPRLWCQDGSYSVYGIFFFDPITSSLRKLMHLGTTIELESEFEWSLLLVYMCVSFVLLVVTYSCSVPGGVLVPILAIGACYGRLVAFLVEAALDNTEENVTSFATYAVIGSACLLSGVTRMTLSITVLIMETTGSLQLTIPMMIAIFFAKIFGDLTGTGLYDAYIELKGVPFLPEDKMGYEHKMLSEKLDVEEIMTGGNLVYLTVRPTVRNVLEVLQSCEHSVFPILAEDMEMEFDAVGISAEGGMTKYQMLGSICRAQLITMLEKRIGFVQGDDQYEIADETLSSVRQSLSTIPLKKDVRDQDSVLSSLRGNDMSMRMDLSEFMQLDPHVISADANVSKAYRLFQNMGLSHLYVAPSGATPIVGIITRKDLTLENCKLQLGERAAYEMKLMQNSDMSAKGSNSI